MRASSRRRGRGSILVQALVLAGASCARPASGPPGAEPSPVRDALATFAVDARSTAKYELAIEACTEAKCPVVVRLAEGGRVLATATLAWESSSRDATPVDVDPRWGTGDPLAAETPPKGWVSGEEALALTILVRPVRLAPERTALLVTQFAGWDHLKRSHELFLADGGKLVRAWFGAERAGPTWSSAEIVPGLDGSEQVLFVSGFQSPSTDQPDRLSVQLVAWDAAQGRVIETPGAGAAPIRLVSFGGFAEIEAAQKARDEAAACVTPVLFVLDSAAYRGVRGRFFLGTVTARPDLLPSIIEKGKSCARPVTGVLLAYDKAL